MIGSLDTAVLQQMWWILISVIGSLFLFLNFVQGGQTLLWQVAKSEEEKTLIINSLGTKWELTFTTLVMFGGALFASFPKFYSVSFGGGYLVWMGILFSFIIQAVSYEYRKKPNNFLGAKTYELFLFINGSIGILLIGAAVGTFFTGSNFTLNEYNQVTWTNPLRGLEAAFSLFNLSLGLFLVFNARTLGSMYLLNNIDFTKTPELEQRLRKCTLRNFIVSLIFLLYIVGYFVFANGFDVNSAGLVTLVKGKYLSNILSMPVALISLLVGLLLVVWGVFSTSIKNSFKGIWFGGLGTVLIGLTVFFIAGFHNTAFYPSKVDLQSSLTIYNASSSHITLTAMLYVALFIPVVLGYISIVWKKMNAKKLTLEEISSNDESY